MVRKAATRRARGGVRERGAAAVLAMMFLVIFASLATAMAVVSHGNLRTADSHLRMTRAMAASDAGMRYTQYMLQKTIRDNPAAFTTAAGEVNEALALTMWERLRDELAAEVDVLDGPPEGLRFGPIAVAPSERLWFVVTLYPHPVPDDTSGPAWENHPLRNHYYLETAVQPTPFYNRAPYDAATPAQYEGDLRVKTGITKPITQEKLDGRYVRLVVQGIDGNVDEDTGAPAPNSVTRTLSMDLRITKRLDVAAWSRSRLMIGRNVMIQGNIGSSFLDVHLENGHPIQMESDFRGLSDDLDDMLDNLAADLGDGADKNGDNRLSLANEVPAELREEMAEFDVNADGYVDDFDLFFKEFDGKVGTADNRITVGELEAGGVSAARAQQLVELIDSFYPDYDAPGTPEDQKKAGVIDFYDRYTKVRGTAAFEATTQDWEDGAADGNYHNAFEGPIDPKRGEAATKFGVEDLGFVSDIDGDGTPDPFQKSFGVETYRNLATGDLAQQGILNPVDNDPTDGESPEYQPDGAATRESVPYKAAFPYDYYERKVFKNMEFNNLFIPKGWNALFVNCTFRGVTYVETYTGNRIDHPMDANANAFNYSGMSNADGSPKHPDLDANLNLPEGASTTKQLGNNIRFDACKFLGPIVSGGANGEPDEQPEAFSHTRNKLTFTSENGATEFPDLDELLETGEIDSDQWDLYRRGQIIAPHMSVEIGSYDPAAADDIHLSGAVVAGVLDMRGQIELNGSIVTTYEPQADDGTVMGDTSPQFNTTIGYFGQEQGDLEASTPESDSSWGNIKIRYDPSLPLPDGILMTVKVEPLGSTYYEGTK